MPIEDILDIKQKAYRLLEWLNKSIEKKFISVSAAQGFISNFFLAKDWLIEHYKNIPENAKLEILEEKHLNSFLYIFSSYAYTSFKINKKPRLIYIPHNMRETQNEKYTVENYIVALKLDKKDKLSTLKYKIDTLIDIALEENILVEQDLSVLLGQNQELNEKTALLTYYELLLERIQGKHYGKTHLALWREFAWNTTGSPKKDFKLNTELIIKSKKEIIEILKMLC